MKTTNKLYHAELGIPKQARTRFGKMPLTYGLHALQAALNDRYGAIDVPMHLDTDTAKVIEVELASDGATEKVLYRVHHDVTHDLVIAVVPRTGYVKTVWLNEKSDAHATLDHRRYAKSA